MNNLNKILIYKTDPNVPTPNIAHPGEDLGMDIYTADTVIIPAKDYAYVKTGIRISFPKGIGAVVSNRSSKGYKQHLLVYPGIIDSGYTGDLAVKVYNMGDTKIELQKYEKFAQLVLQKVYTFDIEVVPEQTFIDTDISNRGSSGFGSTDKGGDVKQ